MKAAIKAQVMEDRDIKEKLCTLLKDTFKDQLLSNPEVVTFNQQVDNFKQAMRDEMQSIYNQLNQEELLFDKVVSMIQDKFTGETIEEWSSDDPEGFVYGWPDQVSVNTLQQNGDTFMIYQKIAFDKSELALVLRMKSFYEQYSGSHNTQVLAYACSIDANVLEIAQQKGIDLHLIPRPTVC